MTRGYQWLLLIGLFATMPLGGCLSRSHRIAVRTSTAPLQTATADDLIKRINDEESKIRTLNATVGIIASDNGAKPETIKEEKKVLGHITLVRPSLSRRIGVSPESQNRSFDMGSNSNEPKIWIRSLTQFTVGSDDTVRLSAQPLGVLLPPVIYDALLLQPIDRKNELAVLEQGEHEVRDPGTEKPALQPDYILDIVKDDGHGYYLSLKTLFDRTDLQPREEIIFDHAGLIDTDVRYDEYKEFNGVLFPTKIRIRRSTRFRSE
jgi:hypothetical protein